MSGSVVTRCLLGGIALAIATSLHAQQPAPVNKDGSPYQVVLGRGARSGDPVRLPNATPTARSLRGKSSAALFERDGTLWGCGDSYKARFDAPGYEFIPALGRMAPHNFPVQYRMESVGRGGSFFPAEPAQRKHDGLTVEFARGGVIERYEVRPEGVEQSFVFHRLPAGGGDLIVRGRLETALQVTPDGDGLKLELPGVGGLRIGGVTGIDARGRKAAGTVRYAAGVLELSLPAAFVDEAALPLVLDPLVGSVFNTFTTNLDDQDPDVAYDLTNDVYLVVFERVFSASDLDVHGQRVSAAGALVGGRVFIENSTTNEFNPAVANVNLRDRFVVVYYRTTGDVMARSVSAATGAVSPEITVAGGTDTQIVPDVGGEATELDDDAICVWHNSTQDRIEAAQVTVAADGTLSVFGLTTIIASSTIPPSSPRISKGGGSTGNHMIVWSRLYSATDSDPQGAIINRNIGLLDTLVWFDSSLTDQDAPDVDGDGTHWVCAWETNEASGTNNDIACRACSWNPNAALGSQGVLVSPITLVEADVNDNEYQATVAWVGDSFVVGWIDDDTVTTSFFNSYFVSIDSFTCDLCESSGVAQGEFWPQGTFNWDFNMQIASERSGGGTGDGALVVLETQDQSGTNTSDIQGQLWRSDDGAVADLGGACGSQAGRIYATCARRGNASFAVRLAGAIDSSPAVLVISRETLYMPCGSCRLIPNAYAGFIVPTATNSSGAATFNAAIPNTASVVGLGFYLQWVVADPGSPSCSLFDADLTNAIRLSIQ